MNKLFVLMTIIATTTAAYGTARTDCNGGITTSTCQSSNSSLCGMINSSVSGFSTGRCTNYDTVWLGTMGATDCTSCVSGATLVQHNDYFQWNNQTCLFVWHECKCTSPATCTSTSWTATGRAGYDTRTVKQLADNSCTTCTSTTEYRCAAGYYGASSNGTSGCTKCPTSGGVNATTVPQSTTANNPITKCYIPANTTMSDDTGDYVFTSDCYYTN